MIMTGIKCSLDSYLEHHDSHTAHVKNVVVHGMETKLTENSNEIADLGAVSGNLGSGILRGDYFKRLFFFPEINIPFFL